MHTVPTGRSSEIREVYDSQRCERCDGLLASPHVLIVHRPCSCAGPGGHRTLRCLHCGHLHYEPPCSDGEGIGSAYG